MNDRKWSWEIWKYETLSLFYVLGTSSLIDIEENGIMSFYLVEFHGNIYWIG
jgi:hypothetical protein